MKRSRGTHLRRERTPDPARHDVRIDGQTYQWEVRHGWGAIPSGGYRGVSVSVWVRRHQTRELIIDFPFDTFGMEPPPAAKLLGEVQRCIPLAIAAGWVPDSRGRAQRFAPGDAAGSPA